MSVLWVLPPVVIKRDNDAARMWATKPMEVTAQTRSITVNYHFLIRDEVAAGSIAVQLIETGDHPHKRIHEAPHAFATSLANYLGLADLSPQQLAAR